MNCLEHDGSTLVGFVELEEHQLHIIEAVLQVVCNLIFLVISVDERLCPDGLSDSQDGVEFEVADYGRLVGTGGCVGSH